MDAIKNAAENKLGKDSQPGDGVERSADNAVDQRTNHPLVACQQPHRPHIAICRHANWVTSTEVDNAAGQAGVPSSDNNTVNEFVNKEVNDKIPGGN